VVILLTVESLHFSVHAVHDPVPTIRFGGPNPKDSVFGRPIDPVNLAALRGSLRAGRVDPFRVRARKLFHAEPAGWGMRAARDSRFLAGLNCV
jgi:hypothetical protein